MIFWFKYKSSLVDSFYGIVGIFVFLRTELLTALYRIVLNSDYYDTFF